jgi:predicted dienelactone hydrolase
MTGRNLIIVFLFAGALTAIYGQTGYENRTPTDLQQSGPKAAAPVLPAPSGPFGIGRIGYEWIDASRSDTSSANPDAHRDLMVYLWYPSPRTATKKRGTYLPGSRQMDASPEVRRRVGDEFGPSWEQIVSGELVSHAVENAPVADAPNRFPVVVFSHGLGSVGFAYTSLIEDLVSHGYAVASIEHTYTAMAVVFPDGRVVTPHQEAAPRASRLSNDFNGCRHPPDLRLLRALVTRYSC